LFLSETSEDEFRQAVERIHSVLNTPPNIPIDLLVQKALGPGLNFRWLQNYLVSLLQTQEPELELKISRLTRKTEFDELEESSEKLERWDLREGPVVYRPRSKRHGIPSSLFGSR
jgi:hypothetical protein